jgi:predicted GNAT superfamily acetyltransferase
MASAGITVRMLSSNPDAAKAEAVLVRVWNSPSSQLSASTMRALEHAGNYVAGAFSADDPETMVGCIVGFFSAPTSSRLHSHIAGVDPLLASRGVGSALKLHQRAWCLAQDVHTMTWTFDPAISRNAYFNLGKLGAVATEYLPDFYGTMTDGLNAGSPSDRVLVEWDLPASLRPHAAPPAAPHGASVVLGATEDGAPQTRAVDSSATTILVTVPRDIESMRRERPALAAQWRLAVRDSLAPLIGSPDWVVTGFTREGTFIVQRAVATMGTKA